MKACQHAASRLVSTLPAVAFSTPASQARQVLRCRPRLAVHDEPLRAKTRDDFLKARPVRAEACRQARAKPECADKWSPKGEAC
jgi:hypothetical protein